MQTPANTVGLNSTQELQSVSRLLSQRSTSSSYLPVTSGKQVLKMPKHRHDWKETGIRDLKHLYLRTNPICLINVKSPSKVIGEDKSMAELWLPARHTQSTTSISMKESWELPFLTDQSTSANPKPSSSETEAAGERLLWCYHSILKTLDGSWVWTTENIQLDAKKTLTFAN